MKRIILSIVILGIIIGLLSFHYSRMKFNPENYKPTKIQHRTVKTYAKTYLVTISKYQPLLWFIKNTFLRYTPIDNFTPEGAFLENGNKGDLKLNLLYKVELKHLGKDYAIILHDVFAEGKWYTEQCYATFVKIDGLWERTEDIRDHPICHMAATKNYKEFLKLSKPGQLENGLQETLENREISSNVITFMSTSESEKNIPLQDLQLKQDAEYFYLDITFDKNLKTHGTIIGEGNSTAVLSSISFLFDIANDMSTVKFNRGFEREVQVIEGAYIHYEKSKYLQKQDYSVHIKDYENGKNGESIFWLSSGGQNIDIMGKRMLIKIPKEYMDLSLMQEIRIGIRYNNNITEKIVTLN